MLRAIGPLDCFEAKERKMVPLGAVLCSTNVRTTTYQSNRIHESGEMLIHQAQSRNHLSFVSRTFVPGHCSKKLLFGLGGRHGSIFFTRHAQHWVVRIYSAPTCHTSQRDGHHSVEHANHSASIGRARQRELRMHRCICLCLPPRLVDCLSIFFVRQPRRIS